MITRVWRLEKLKKEKKIQNDKQNYTENLLDESVDSSKRHEY